MGVEVTLYVGAAIGEVSLLVDVQAILAGGHAGDLSGNDHLVLGLHGKDQVTLDNSAIKLAF